MIKKTLSFITTPYPKWVGLSLLAGIVFSLISMWYINYSYWGGEHRSPENQGTIYSVQTVESNIASAAFPYKLSALIDQDNSKEINRLINSAYGLAGYVITDCQKLLGQCQHEKILYKTTKRNWWLKRDFIKTELYKMADFDLLRSPPPILQEKSYNGPKDNTRLSLLPSDHAQNRSAVIGRVYYVRRNIPSFLTQLQYWSKSNFSPRSTDAKYYTRIVLLYLSISVILGGLLGRYETQRILASKNNLKEKLQFEQELFNQKFLAEQEIREKEEKHRHELEDLMAMFAHKFRGPLDSLDFNFHHGLEKIRFLRSLQTMRGLLDTFSIISSDAEKVVQKLSSDNIGDQTVQDILLNSLESTMSHLTTVNKQSSISQHYLYYAKSHDLVDSNVNEREWYREYVGAEIQLQQKFSNTVFNQFNAESEQEALSLVEELFFTLNITGITNKIHFSPFGLKSSFLTIIFSEILTNAFKYYSSEAHASVIIEWIDSEEYITLLCSTPSTRMERNNQKGSGKGHHFLKTIAEIVGGSFSFSLPKDSSDVCITKIELPRHLFY